MSATLFIVSTSIGHIDDITLRALKILKEVDFIVCEEWKMGKQLLRNYQIDKELLQLNEHNVDEGSNLILNKLLDGKTIALTSDCGTPIFSDPGLKLVQLCYQNKIPVVAIPGVSSLLAALVVCGFSLDKFKFYGWLSKKQDERELELKKLIAEKQTSIILDTPYRLNHLLESVKNILGNNRKICVACDLTTNSELIKRGKAAEVFEYFKKNELKREFVLIIEGIK